MSAQILQLTAVCRFLSRMWLREIDPSIWSELQQPPVAAAFAELGGAVPADCEPSTLEILAVDYCQLLIGPKNQISPIQSVWIEGQFQGNPTASMQRYVELVPDYCPPAEILDHLGVQLDFIGSLIGAVDAEQVHPAILRQFSDRSSELEPALTGSS